MNLINNMAMNADVTVAMDPTGREHVVVVVKGTFLIPDDGGEAVLAPSELQAPLVMADTFTGAPGLSAPVYEAEFCLRKPRCDVLLLGTAYAPEGRPATRVRVGLKVGNWSKTFDVVGDRVWVQRGATLGPSAPTPFTTIPLTYDAAFGGVDDTDPEKSDAYRANPIGKGFGMVRSGVRLAGRALPNTQDPHHPVTVPWESYGPMSFGPVGRSWEPRASYAGTYDQHWLDNIFPLLPADFDDRYFHAAPDDQQIDEPRGGEEIFLSNLTPAGRLRLRLPIVEMPVAFFLRDGAPQQRRAVVDTLLIEPDKNKLYLLWRCNLALQRHVFEIAEIDVGHMSNGRRRARELGKVYYPGLGALVRGQKQRESVDE